MILFLIRMRALHHDPHKTTLGGSQSVTLSPGSPLKLAISHKQITSHSSVCPSFTTFFPHSFIFCLARSNSTVKALQWSVFTFTKLVFEERAAVSKMSERQQVRGFLQSHWLCNVSCESSRYSAEFRDLSAPPDSKFNFLARSIDWAHSVIQGN